MKKIININLSGRVIMIEDTAYEKLKAYIDSLRQYFAKEEGADEIINDIENRIAELMNDKIRKGAPAISDAHIEEIALHMGRPEDFAAEEANEFETGSKQKAEYAHAKASDSAGRKKGRLYRDANDKFLGGVCSGIAEYFGMDPAIVRILFVIVTISGFGFGVFIYILLWVILPSKNLENPITKRLYRNPDDKMIAGVAGGLAAYFGQETKIFRLIFAAPLIIGIFITLIRGIFWSLSFPFFPGFFFGSAGSTFILAYCILWIVLPEAKTDYEKMEMRGEKIDVNKIAKNMKERVREWGEEVKGSAQDLRDKAKKYADTRGQSFTSEVNHAMRQNRSGFFRAIGTLVKVFLLFIVSMIVLCLVVSLAGVAIGGFAWWPVNNFLWTDDWQKFFALGALNFLVLIPLIGLITWLIRRIMGIRSRHSYLGWIFGILWMGGWVSLVLFGISMAREFREYEGTGETSVATVRPDIDKLTLTVSDPKLYYGGNFSWMMNDHDHDYDYDGQGFDLSSDTLKLSWINFNIDKSLDSLYHVSVRTYSFGSTKDAAIDRAEKLQYKVIVRDSMLDLANGFSIYKDDKWRGQTVVVNIQVPVGKKIRLDESVKGKLIPAVVMNDKSHANKKFSFKGRKGVCWKADVDYTMQENGKLIDKESNKEIDADCHKGSHWRKRKRKTVEM
ncbi:MAG: PspC domain-containing protein [Sporocytophaga sp.]|uniref:PspC domain-containing protein n=1 Tax=Sporocytophaga sp. TaxID=2231183 RepID=UPI001B16C844|nr:PspC domain-containing protein [Sporocytophaga sp.]MBO9702958.1 PspC domain-containing protein [Sporocytophaga sp.]